MATLLDNIDRVHSEMESALSRDEIDMVISQYSRMLRGEGIAFSELSPAQGYWLGRLVQSVYDVGALNRFTTA